MISAWGSPTVAGCWVQGTNCWLATTQRWSPGDPAVWRASYAVGGCSCSIDQAVLACFCCPHIAVATKPPCETPATALKRVPV
jgi:hypothetical protein